MDLPPRKPWVILPSRFLPDSPLLSMTRRSKDRERQLAVLMSFFREEGGRERRGENTLYILHSPYGRLFGSPRGGFLVGRTGLFEGVGYGHCDRTLYPVYRQVPRIHLFVNPGGTLVPHLRSRAFCPVPTPGKRNQAHPSECLSTIKKIPLKASDWYPVEVGERWFDCERKAHFSGGSYGGNCRSLCSATCVPMRGFSRMGLSPYIPPGFTSKLLQLQLFPVYYLLSQLIPLYPIPSF